MGKLNKGGCGCKKTKIKNGNVEKVPCFERKEGFIGKMVNVVLMIIMLIIATPVIFIAIWYIGIRAVFTGEMDFIKSAIESITGRKDKPEEILTEKDLIGTI